MQGDKASEINTCMLAGHCDAGNPSSEEQGDYELWPALATYNLAQEDKTHDTIVSYFQCFFSP